MDYFNDINFVSVNKQCSRRDSSACRVADYWGIGLILGNGYVKRQEKERCTRLKMPFLYLIEPGVDGCWAVVDEAPRENRWFVARGERAQRMVESLSPLCREVQRVIFLKDYQDLIAVHQQMLKLYQLGIPAKAYHLALAAEQFVAAVYDALSQSKQSSPLYSKIAESMKQILENPARDWDLAALAKKNNVSQDHFRRCFREYVGLPPQEFLLQKRLELSLTLLRKDSGNVKEISALCGFKRQAEFSRFIKLRTGLTPTQLRMQPCLEGL